MNTPNHPLQKEVEKRKIQLKDEIELLLKDFSSRPENKGFDFNLEEDSIWCCVDVIQAECSAGKKNDYPPTAQH